MFKMYHININKEVIYDSSNDLNSQITSITKQLLVTRIINSLITKADVIIYTETWNCKIPNLYALKSYNLHLYNCSINKADGVAMYIKSNINVTVKNISLDKPILLEAHITCCNSNLKL